MPELNTTLTGTVIKSIDLPDDVVKAAKDVDVDHWFYATVESEDRDGDVVRVKGLRTAADVPFIVGHKLTPNDNGTLPVIGKTLGWHKTTHKSLGLPAMVAGVKFAPTPLGREFKQLYDDGFLTEVSIRFTDGKAEPIRGGKGYDVQEAEIIELSACIKGVNRYSSILKAVQVEQDETRINAAVARIEAAADKFEQAVANRIKSIQSVADDLESALVAKSHAPERAGDDTSGTDDEIDWTPVVNALKGVTSTLRK